LGTSWSAIVRQRIHFAFERPLTLSLSRRERGQSEDKKKARGSLVRGLSCSELCSGSFPRVALARGAGQFALFFLRLGGRRGGNLARLGKTDGLADAVAEIEELGATGFAAALHDDLGNERGMDREDTLDAFVVDDAADREGLVDTVT